MNLLVTGANGFIGYKLCEKLLNIGWHVRGTVRPSTYRNNLPFDVDVVPIEEIGPLTDWSKVMSGVDTVVHLAARVHLINDIAADVSDAYGSVNVAGTERLARMAAACGIRRFIYLSTVKVNGEGRSSPYTEKDNPKPIDPYGISKWESEKRLHKIINHTELEVVILRPPMVYGPGVKANFLRLLNVVERGIPLPLAKVNNHKSLIYLENLLDAIVTCINHPRAAGQTFLVSDDRDLSTPALIRLMAQAMGRKVRLFSFPPDMLKIIGKITGRSAEIDRLLGSLCVDSSKIRGMLGWKPPYTSEEGIREMGFWYTKNRRG